MVSEADLGQIQNLISDARAALTAAKKDLMDMKNAGLVEEAKTLEMDIQENEMRLTKLESVYGRR